MRGAVPHSYDNDPSASVEQNASQFAIVVPTANGVFYFFGISIALMSETSRVPIRFAISCRAMTVTTI